MSLRLEFTPLEFETSVNDDKINQIQSIRIYSVGVWNAIYENKIIEMLKLEFTPLEFETAEKLGFVWADIVIRFYSVGVWNMQHLQHHLWY